MTSFNRQGTTLPPEAKLRLLENIVMRANDAVVVTDAEPVEYPGPRIVYVNPAFTAMTGYTAKEVIGQTPRLLQGPLTDADILAKIRAALDAGQPIVVEVLNYHKNGTTFWVELSMSPFADENGRLTHWISVQRDITARRAAREALRRSEDFLARAGMLSGVGGWELDVQSGALAWSGETSRIYGLPAGEVPGLEDAINYYPAEARPVVRAALARCISHGAPFRHDLPFNQADGTRIWVRLVGEAVYENGVLIRLAGAFQDISGQVAERAAQARADAEFRASFEGSLFGKLLAEPKNRRIIRANTAFAKLLGCEPDELVGRRITEFTWHEDQPADAEDYRRLLAGEITANVQEKRYVRRDGTPFWVLVSATLAWPAGSAEPSIAVISAQDIDARINDEAALRTTALELELALAGKTSALAQRDLLLQEVYHRVKNNLQVVDSLLTMQSRRLDDWHSKQALLDLRRRVHAIGLVHEQLMESPDLKTFDIVPFLAQLSRHILDGGGKDGVTMQVETCSLQIGLDFAVPLGLLVTELVTNSLKHAVFPGGNGLIRVTLQDEPGALLRLTVSDNGQGRDTRTPANGTKPGMGTSIIKSLVAQLEGSMEVRIDQGTTTEIRMPMPVTP